MLLELSFKPDQPEWIDYGDHKVASLRRSQTGSIAPITTWPDYGDQQVAPLRRSRIGTIAPINNTLRDILIWNP
jgi:hypothetical protein